MDGAVDAVMCPLQWSRRHRQELAPSVCVDSSLPTARMHGGAVDALMCLLQRSRCHHEKLAPSVCVDFFRSDSMDGGTACGCVVVVHAWAMLC
jgi:hypothetical protein